MSVIAEPRPNPRSKQHPKQRIAASPLARRLAQENQLDLARLIGTGPAGRIIKRDIETALQNAPQFAQATQQATADKLVPQAAPDKAAPQAASQTASQAASQTASASLPDPRLFFSPDDYEQIPLSPMMSSIAERLQTAKQQIPHYQVAMDIRLDKLLSLRARLNQALADAQTGEKLTVNDFIIRAVALSLMEVPQVNVSFLGDSLLRYKCADISVAVALPDGGLITPIVKSAHAKSLRQIAREIKELAARATELRLKPAEYEGGTFSISNLGMFGVAEFNAIINPPQAAILAVAASELRYVPETDEAADETAEEVTDKTADKAGYPQFGHFMRVTLSCDHRAINGAEAARFLNAFKAWMQAPLALLF